MLGLRCAGGPSSSRSATRCEPKLAAAGSVCVGGACAHCRKRPLVSVRFGVLRVGKVGVLWKKTAGKRVEIGKMVVFRVKWA